HISSIYYYYYLLLLYTPSSSFSSLPPPLTSTLFPYTTLFRSSLVYTICTRYRLSNHDIEDVGQNVWLLLVEQLGKSQTFCPTSSDRKSTRLNSSHVKISYAVFCLKKKKK